MGGITKAVGKVFGIDNSAAKRAAEQQAAATRAAADAQVRQLNQQAQGTALAQQASINQAHLAAQLRTQEQQQSAQAPVVKLESRGPAEADPRRKYRNASGGNIGGVGATPGGISIRL